MQLISCFVLLSVRVQSAIRPVANWSIASKPCLLYIPSPLLSAHFALSLSLCHLEVLYYKLSFTFLPSPSLSAIFFFFCFSSDSRIVPQATNCHPLSLPIPPYLSFIQVSCIRCRMMKTCTILIFIIHNLFCFTPHSQHSTWRHSLEGQVQYQFSQTENV